MTLPERTLKKLNLPYWSDRVLYTMATVVRGVDLYLIAANILFHAALSRGREQAYDGVQHMRVPTPLIALPLNTGHRE